MRLLQLIFVALSLLALNGCIMSTAPMIRVYHGKDACGLACYSHNPQGIYRLFTQPYLEGVVVVRGKYDGYICKPANYKDINRSAISKFDEICDTQIKGCEIAKKTTGKGCWADVNSGNLVVLP